ncbi:hypothetical protein ACFRJ1_15755 [Streptomyces sp. NPDC056773]|uniref:hypothetical protein n=1 Tax=unclassified Streptomyces TaxID=2593676 RepID=UPI0036CB5B1C
MARGRGGWNTKSTWIAAVCLAAVLVLTAYSFLARDSEGGSDKQPVAQAPTASPGASAPASPQATYEAPEDWTEPEKWAALPRGQRTDKDGSQVGYPHTAEGAAAMAAAASTTRVEGEHSTSDEQMRIYASYMGKADQTADNAKKVKAAAEQTDKKLAAEMGVNADQPLPLGAYVRSHVVGYKVIKKSDDEVSVWLLARVVQRSGESAKESSSYTRTLLGMQWQDGDWKLTADASRRAQVTASNQSLPPMVAPGDEEFNSGGWTAIREAS